MLHPVVGGGRRGEPQYPITFHAPWAPRRSIARWQQRNPVDGGRTGRPDPSDGRQPTRNLRNGEVEREVAAGRCHADPAGAQRHQEASDGRDPAIPQQGVVGDRRPLHPQGERDALVGYPPSAHVSRRPDDVIDLGFNPDDGPAGPWALQPWRPLIISASSELCSKDCSAVCATLPTVPEATTTRSTTSSGSHGNASAFHFPRADPDRCRPSCSDVRKRYRPSRTRKRQIGSCVATEAPSAEEQFVSHAFLEELPPQAPRRGISDEVLRRSCAAGLVESPWPSSPPSSRCRSKCCGIAGGAEASGPVNPLAS